MLKYSAIKPRVYIESTVVSYLVARLSNNPIVASRQRASQQLWEDYADRFEFVISRVVLAEIQRGNATAAQQRLEAVSQLTVLEVLPEANVLAQKLIDAGAVPLTTYSANKHWQPTLNFYRELGFEMWSFSLFLDETPMAS